MEFVQRAFSDLGLTTVSVSGVVKIEGLSRVLRNYRGCPTFHAAIDFRQADLSELELRSFLNLLKGNGVRKNGTTFFIVKSLADRCILKLRISIVRTMSNSNLDFHVSNNCHGVFRRLNLQQIPCLRELDELPQYYTPTKEFFDDDENAESDTPDPAINSNDASEIYWIEEEVPNEDGINWVDFDDEALLSRAHRTASAIPRTAARPAHGLGSKLI